MHFKRTLGLVGLAALLLSAWRVEAQSALGPNAWIRGSNITISANAWIANAYGRFSGDGSGLTNLAAFGALLLSDTNSFAETLREYSRDQTNNPVLVRTTTTGYTNDLMTKIGSTQLVNSAALLLVNTNSFATNILNAAVAKTDGTATNLIVRGGTVYGNGVGLSNVTAKNIVPGIGVPLDMPTWDGTNSSTHFNVIHLDYEIGGYRWHGVHTPYPTIEREVVEYVVSNDGVTWIKHPWLSSNILFGNYGSAATYVPDPEIYFRTTNSLLYAIAYELGGNDGTYQTNYVQMRASPNGVIWTSISRLFTNVTWSTNFTCLGPEAVSASDGTLRIYYVDNNSVDGATNRLRYRESSDWTNFGTEAQCTLHGIANNSFWHFDIQRRDATYHLLGCGAGGGVVRYWTSTDGVSFSLVSSDAIVLSGGTNDFNGIYKPCMVQRPNNKWDLYLSCYNPRYQSLTNSDEYWKILLHRDTSIPMQGDELSVINPSLFQFLTYSGSAWSNAQNPIVRGFLSVTNPNSSLSFAVADQDGDTTPFVIDQSGNVGFGTNAPQWQIDAKDSVRLAGASPFMLFEGLAATAKPRMQWQSNGTTRFSFGLNTNGGWYFTTGGFTPETTAAFGVSPTGNVRIGSGTNFASERFEVGGNAIITSNIVAGWSGQFHGNGAGLSNVVAASSDSYYPTNVPLLSLDDSTASFPNSLKLTASTGITLVTNTGNLEISSTGGGQPASANLTNWSDLATNIFDWKYQPSDPELTNWALLSTNIFDWKYQPSDAELTNWALLPTNIFDWKYQPSDADLTNWATLSTNVLEQYATTNWVLETVAALGAHIYSSGVTNTNVLFETTIRTNQWTGSSTVVTNTTTNTVGGFSTDDYIRHIVSSQTFTRIDEGPISVNAWIARTSGAGTLSIMPEIYFLNGTNLVSLAYGAAQSISGAAPARYSWSVSVSSTNLPQACRIVWAWKCSEPGSGTPILQFISGGAYDSHASLVQATLIAETALLLTDTNAFAQSLRDYADAATGSSNITDSGYTAVARNLTVSTGFVANGSISVATNIMSNTNAIDMLIPEQFILATGTISISNLLNVSDSQTRSVCLVIDANGGNRTIRVPDSWTSVFGGTDRVWTLGNGGLAQIMVKAVEGRYTNYHCSLDVVAQGISAVAATQLVNSAAVLISADNAVTGSNYFSGAMVKTLEGWVTNKLASTNSFELGKELTHYAEGTVSISNCTGVVDSQLRVGSLLLVCDGTSRTIRVPDWTLTTDGLRTWTLTNGIRARLTMEVWGGPSGSRYTNASYTPLY